MTAFVVTAACGSKKPADPLGPLHVTKDGGSQAQVDVASRQNSKGIVAYRAGKFAEASDRFREAVERIPEPGYLINLCLSLFHEDKLEDALRSCEAVQLNESATPPQRAQVERVFAQIKTEAKRRGIQFRPIGGNPPPPGWEPPGE
jgi:hypothetical protein